MIIFVFLPGDLLSSAPPARDKACRMGRVGKRFLVGLCRVDSGPGASLPSSASPSRGRGLEGRGLSGGVVYVPAWWRHSPAAARPALTTHLDCPARGGACIGRGLGVGVALRGGATSLRGDVTARPWPSPPLATHLDARKPAAVASCALHLLGGGSPPSVTPPRWLPEDLTAWTAAGEVKA